uniref:X8 domain-containing protein n=1 Tax=Oryza rufipogon TaxID=4529 RepID=A0A0E0NBQ7_ORYRU
MTSPSLTSSPSTLLERRADSVPHGDCGASARRGLTTVSVTKPSYPTVTTPMSASTSPSTMPMSSSSSEFPSLVTAGGGDGGGSWCVASPTALQVPLHYACGHGTDCSAIQPGGSCFNPDTVHDHASYAFNSYYQKNPIATSCDFSGTAPDFERGERSGGRRKKDVARLAASMRRAGRGAEGEMDATVVLNRPIDQAAADVDCRLRVNSFPRPPPAPRRHPFQAAAPPPLSAAGVPG